MRVFAFLLMPKCQSLLMKMGATSCSFSSSTVCTHFLLFFINSLTLKGHFISCFSHHIVLIANGFDRSSTWWMCAYVSIFCRILLCQMSNEKSPFNFDNSTMTAPLRNDVAAITPPHPVVSVKLISLNCGGDDDPSIRPPWWQFPHPPPAPRGIIRWSMAALHVTYCDNMSGMKIGTLHDLIWRASARDIERALFGDASSFAARRDAPYSQSPSALRLRLVSAADLSLPSIPHQSHLISTSGGTMRGRARVASHYPHCPFINVL